MWYGDFIKIGVLGGGQLGRMLIQAAINYDIQLDIMDSSKSAPCGYVAHNFVEGDILNYDDVLNFGKDKEVLTIEIENVNVDALEELEKRGVKVYPQPRVLRIIQDKGLQKEFYQQHGIPTAPFHLIRDKKELQTYSDKIPFVQKLRKGGYDGKGVHVINSVQDIETGFSAPSLIEDKIPFQKELSVLVARNSNGEIKAFPTVECEFSEELNLVEFLFSPAEITPEIEEKALTLAREVIEKLNMVGLLAVEMFLTEDGQLLVNEVAPRPHNSGHHTIECNNISQFEQHLRAILNLPLGNTDLVISGVMINLLGSEEGVGKATYRGLEEAMAKKGVYFHAYGKAETKPHRKMGHITIANQDIDKAKKLAREIQKQVQVVPFSSKNSKE